MTGRPASTRPKSSTRPTARAGRVWRPAGRLSRRARGPRRPRERRRARGPRGARRRPGQAPRTAAAPAGAAVPRARAGRVPGTRGRRAARHATSPAARVRGRGHRIRPAWPGAWPGWLGWPGRRGRPGRVAGRRIRTAVRPDLDLHAARRPGHRLRPARRGGGGVRQDRRTRHPGVRHPPRAERAPAADLLRDLPGPGRIRQSREPAVHAALRGRAKDVRARHQRDRTPAQVRQGRAAARPAAACAGTCRTAPGGTAAGGVGGPGAAAGPAVASAPPAAFRPAAS